MIFKAIEFAAKAHSGQYRKKTKIPYIVHPLAVADILIEHNCPDEVVIAAVLHDTVEDTHVTLDDIKVHFGEKIAALVRDASEPDKSQSWEKRKTHTIESIAHLPIDALVLICADKLHNLKSIRKDLEKQGESVWQRFNHPKEKQKWYFESILAALRPRMRGSSYNPLFREFETEVNRVFNLSI